MKRQDKVAVVMTAVILILNVAYLSKWMHMPDCSVYSLLLALVFGNTLLLTGWYTIDSSLTNNQ